MMFGYLNTNFLSIFSHQYLLGLLFDQSPSILSLFMSWNLNVRKEGGADSFLFRDGYTLASLFFNFFVNLFS